MTRLVGFWNEGAAELLRRTLEEQGLRVEVLARQLRVTPRTVRNWMRFPRPRHPRVENLRDLCAELSLTQEDFRAAARAYEAGYRSTSAAQPTSDGPALQITEEEPKSHSDGDVPPDLISFDARYDSRSLDMETHIGSRLKSWTASARLWTLLFLFVALGVTAALLIGLWHSAASPTNVSPLVTFDLPAEASHVYDRAFGGELSPDGSQIAFLARALPSKKQMLFIHSVTDRRTRPLPASEGPYTDFFWNVDSRSIFFISKKGLVKIGIDGGAPELVANIVEALKGTVNGRNTIVLGSRRGLLRVTDSGAEEALTKVRPDEIAHSLPFFLPDDDRILFTITRKAPNGTVSRLAAVYSLRSRATQLLFPIATGVQYANGHLLYVRERTLFARRFDIRQLRFTAPERPVASPVWADHLSGEAGFSVSEAALVVTPPPHIPPLYLLGVDGTIRATISDPEDIRYVAVGRTTDQLVLVARGDVKDRTSLWLYPLDGRERVRLVANADRPSSPVFSPDDRTVYYADVGKSWANIYAVDVSASGGRPRTVLSSSDIVAPRDISPDGGFLLLERWQNRDGSLWFMPVGDPRRVERFVVTPDEEGESARFSPDGSRVAFVAKRGEHYSVYIANFPPVHGLAKQAIDGDGWRVRWSDDGKHVYFARGSSVMEAELSSGRTRRLFDMGREIMLLEPARDAGFFVREVAATPNRTVATGWWPRLADQPLELSVATR